MNVFISSEANFCSKPRVMTRKMRYVRKIDMTLRSHLHHQWSLLWGVGMLSSELHCWEYLLAIEEQRLMNSDGDRAPLLAECV